MENIINIIVTVVFAILGVSLFASIMIRLIKDRFSAEKTVKATLIDKNTYKEQVASRAEAAYPKQRYVVVFDCNGKKKSFYVSEFSYNGYRKGEKGYLTYKGSRMIGFSKCGQ